VQPFQWLHAVVGECAGAANSPSSTELLLCWQLLAALLSKGGQLLQGSSISPNLCAAAAAAVTAATADSSSSNADLAGSLLRLFSALCGGSSSSSVGPNQQQPVAWSNLGSSEVSALHEAACGQQLGVGSCSSGSSSCLASVCSTFRPSLEQQAALLQACLTQSLSLQQQQHSDVAASEAAGTAPTSSSSWQALAVLVMHWFRRSSLQHTNPKKVSSSTCMSAILSQIVRPCY
jgi:hypothetical protein